jgi:hypothetical protein
MIWLVRRELEWAREVDADSPLRFQVDAVELDVAVEASRTTTGNGGLDLKVLGWGISGEATHEITKGTATTVHVVLTPQNSQSSSGRYIISGRDTEPPPRRAESSEGLSQGRIDSTLPGDAPVDQRHFEPPAVRVKPDS